ncbi:MAG TPA: sugar-binding domain-containing protein [Pilimelia sp.]|nr:sugar-binding domain-containing protein [Pilimelia sp.]
MPDDVRSRRLRPAELIRAAAIARRYYLDGASKLDIAAEFGLSRFKVARVLEEARRSGLVHIEIAVPAEIDAELSEALRTAYDLRQAIVVSVGENPADAPRDSLRDYLGAVAADYLTEVVTDGDVLGLACSRTLNAMTLALSGIAPCTVVQLTGALSGVRVEANSVELVRRVASLAGGPAYPIYAPLVVPDPATAAALREQPEVADAMARYPDITKAVVAVGSWDPPDSLVRAAMPAAESAALQAGGVQAEVCARLLDRDGRAVGDLNDRVIAITEEQLRKVPEVIAVSGGSGKAEAIRAVLRGRLITSLVTDAGVARALLASGSDDARPA